MLVAVRAADLTIVVVIESLWRAGAVCGTGEDGRGCASRRRGSGLGFGSSAGADDGALP